MFDVPLRQLGDAIDVIDQMVDVSERSRVAVTAGKPGGELRDELVVVAPGEADWRRFDHCSCVTRLYAVFEEFVRAIVQNWLAQLPQFYATYEDLPEPTRKAYRVGVGEILTKYGGERYSHLTEDQVVRGLADGLAGDAYTLGLDAFFTDDRNLRHDRIQMLFAQVGVPDVWGRVTESREVIRWRTIERGDQTTPQAELNLFVLYRNEASHGSVGTILSADGLHELAAFVKLLATALADGMRGELVSLLERSDEVVRLGTVIGEFSNDILGVETLDVRVANGDSLLIRDGRNAYPTTVISIEIDHQRLDAVECKPGTKIGVRVTRTARVGTEVWVMKSEHPVT